MKIFEFNIKDRRILSIILCLILICVFTLTLAYAALSVTLNIQGNAEVVASSWDIYLDNAKVKTGSVAGTGPTITNKTTASFSTTLNKPGDFYEFTIDVVNNGSIDAMIESISKTPTLTSSQSKYLNYIIEYQNGDSITTKQLVSKNSFVRLKVKVEYRKDLVASDLPITSETLNLKFTVNYTQGDETASNVKDNGAWVISADGSLDDIGTIVTIGSEQFYTIGTEDNNVKLLSMYNLYVGGYYHYAIISGLSSDGSGIELNKLNNNLDKIYVEKLAGESTVDIFRPFSNPTGMQESTMRGHISSGYARGVTPFSSDTKKGTNYTDYNGSIVEGYVNNYKDLLEFNFDINIVEARLITKEELTSDAIGCSSDSWTCRTSEFEWIYFTSYWTGTANNFISLWRVLSDGYFSNAGNYYEDSYNGVRPVIVISKDYFN